MRKRLDKKGHSERQADQTAIWNTSALRPSGSAPCSCQCERQVECARQHIVRHAQAAAVVGQAAQAAPYAAIQAVVGAAPRMA